MVNPSDPDFTLNPASKSRANIEAHLIDWNDDPVLTIVTPFYNTGLIFQETARCILDQSLQQWEWLIINDGSTDQQALELLAEFRQKDQRIRVIDHAENRGLSAARNTGFAQARCEYVLLIDSDDLLEPTAAEKWWWFLETHPQYSFVASNHVAFGGKNYLWTGGFHDGDLNTDRNRVSMMCVVRKSVYLAVGGFDETMRDGLEDWEFWMRCAAHGYWGATVPEYLAWYRLREDHSDRWVNLNESRLDDFRKLLHSKYPGLYTGQFPKIIEQVDFDLTTVLLDPPLLNKLRKNHPHLLLILPFLKMGGVERFSLNLIDQLIDRGWTISIITTQPSDNPWLYEFEKRTSDIFILPNLIPIKEYPRFISYFIQSRGCDAILLQGSNEGYRLTPFIRTTYPDVTICDYLHFVTPEWMQGGYPRLSILYQDFIDFTFTSCQQVCRWLVEAGGKADRSQVCYIGIDPETWKPDQSIREQVRKELGIEQAEVIILYAARLEEQKQPGIFIETIHKLSAKGGKFHALVAGEGSLQAEVERKVEMYGLQNLVHMLSSVPIGKMPSIMAAADILFLPSENEGISQALFEAMACELVVVSSQVGGQDELVTPDCGVLYDHQAEQNEANEYSSILYNLINDPTLRRKMAIASRKRMIEGFTVSMMGDTIDHTLRKIIEKKRGNNIHNVPLAASPAIYRETQNLVEYLQAKREFQNLDHNYSELIQPRTPSYWFYLWMRELFLPVFTRINTSILGNIIVKIQKRIKGYLLNE